MCLTWFTTPHPPRKPVNPNPPYDYIDAHFPMKFIGYIDVQTLSQLDSLRNTDRKTLIKRLVRLAKMSPPMKREYEAFLNELGPALLWRYRWHVADMNLERLVAQAMKSGKITKKQLERYRDLHERSKNSGPPRIFT